MPKLLATVLTVKGREQSQQLPLTCGSCSDSPHCSSTPPACSGEEKEPNPTIKLLNSNWSHFEGRHGTFPQELVLLPMLQRFCQAALSTATDLNPGERSVLAFSFLKHRTATGKYKYYYTRNQVKFFKPSSL